jgi:hypothetical protein
MGAVEVNYNLLNINKWAWRRNVAKFAISQLVNTGSVQRTLRAVRSEITKSRIVRDIIKKDFLAGKLSFPEYNETKGRIEIRGDFSDGNGSYLLTPEGFYLHGKQRLFDPLNYRYAKCEKLRDIVRLHNPMLAKKLDGHSPR